MARFAPVFALTALALLAILPTPTAGASLAAHHGVARRDDLHHSGALAKRRVRKRCAAPSRTAATTAASSASSPVPGAANVEGAPTAGSVTAGAPINPTNSEPASDSAPTTDAAPSSDAAPTTDTPAETAHVTTKSSSSSHSSSVDPASSPAAPPSSSAAPDSSSAEPASSSAAPPTSKSTSTKAKPTSSSSASPPAATVTTTSGNSNNKKVGLLWNNAIPSALPKWKSAKVGGLYNWSPWYPPSAKEAGIPFFPMLWGDKDASGWLDTVVEGYATLALGMNEVNQEGQSQMNVSHGAYLWRTYMQPLVARGYELASPSISSAPNGLPWLVDWMNECADCWSSTKYAVVHYYGTDAQAFIAYLNSAHQALNKDLMVTEMACEDFGSGPQCSQSDVFAFLDTVTAFMDATPWVHMYFWFGLVVNLDGGVSQVNGMMNGDGSPNQLGLDYLS